MVMMIMNAGSNDVDVICRETIKPSSPTPHTHKTFKLSFLEQLLPTFYVPVIFFYPKPDNDLINNITQIQNLKTSFSEALSLYYPLAGQLDPQNLTVVDCNDAGAQFVEARAHARVDDVIQDPQMDQLLKYLPLDPSTVIGSGDVSPPLLAVQVSFFDCGGMAVGVCSSHQLTDAVSLMAFIGSWAETCRQGQKSKLTPPPPPVFTLAQHFPPKDLSGSGFSHSMCEKREKLVTKRYIFDTEKLAALRRAVTSAAGTTVKHPTRVELVTTFIWRSIIEGSGKKDQVSAAWHIMNLRPRIKSRPMENVFGNCILKRFVFSEGGGEESHELVSRLRNGLKEVNEEFIWKIAGKDDECYVKDFSKCNGGEMESCGFSSWSRLPVYEMDFGMGKPVWVCPTTCPEKNVCFLMGTKDGSGIELWVNMLESTLQLVDVKFQLLLAGSQV